MARRRAARQVVVRARRWVTAVKNDTSDLPAYEKVVKNKPADGVDGCWQEAKGDQPAVFLAEPQTFGREPDSECNKIYPSFSFVRQVAGGPLDGNVLKCQLKPIDQADYSVTFSASELQRLGRLFPDGVCDWSKPGVSQVAVVPWASFGPAPGWTIGGVNKQQPIRQSGIQGTAE